MAKISLTLQTGRKKKNNQCQSRLNDEEEKLLKFIKSKKGVSSQDIAKKFKISQSTALRRVNKLLKLKLVKSCGNAKTTVYLSS